MYTHTRTHIFASCTTKLFMNHLLVSQVSVLTSFFLLVDPLVPILNVISIDICWKTADNVLTNKRYVTVSNTIEFNRPSKNV